MSGDHTHTRLVVDHSQGTVPSCLHEFVHTSAFSGGLRLHGRLLYLNSDTPRRGVAVGGRRTDFWITVSPPLRWRPQAA